MTYLKILGVHQKDQNQAATILWRILYVKCKRWIMNLSCLFTTDFVDLDPVWQNVEFTITGFRLGLMSNNNNVLVYEDQILKSIFSHIRTLSTVCVNFIIHINI